MKEDLKNCKHKWDLLSHTSGGGNDYQINKNVIVCLKCGLINASGYERSKDGNNKWDEYIHIDIPKAVVAVIKNCNCMCEDTGYPPLLTKYDSFKSQHEELVNNAKEKINKHSSHKVIKIARQSNINCYRGGKVFNFGFMEDLNFILPSDLFKLAYLS